MGVCHEVVNSTHQKWGDTLPAEWPELSRLPVNESFSSDFFVVLGLVLHCSE